MGYLTILISSALITGFIGQYVAKEKNREQGEGFVLGFLLSVLGIIIVALLPTKPANTKPVVKKELTEDEKQALAEKKRKFEEGRIRGQKIVARNNKILLGIIIAFMLIAAIMMLMKNQREAQELERYKSEQRM